MTKKRQLRNSVSRACFFSAILTGLCGLVLTSGCNGREEGVVTVSSSPPGAALWSADKLLDKTPCKIRVAPQTAEKITARLPGYKDASLTLNGSKKKVLITLAPNQDGALVCSSDPVGAKLFVDGEYVGVTPTRVTDLALGQHQVTLQAKDYQQVTKTVLLTSDNAVQKLQLTLPNKLVAFYLKAMKDDPKELEPYADLGHYYVLQHQFEKAADTFDEGLRLSAEGGTRDANRLWAEVQRVLVCQYVYGNEKQVQEARKVMAEHLKKLEESGDVPGLELEYNYIIALRVSGDRKAAQQEFASAWQEHPGNRLLRRLRWEYKFTTY